MSTSFVNFQSAKSVRRSRPQLICSEEEYKCCYDVVNAFKSAKQPPNDLVSIP